MNTELLWESKTPRFTPRGTHNSNVISIQIFPGIRNSKVLPQMLGAAKLKGAVLQAYGAGNGPTSGTFLASLEAAVQKGKIIVDVTQCFSGAVRLGQYETGVGLMARGVLSGSDLTPEAALCKLMVLLGRTEMAGEVETYVQRSLAGEQSESSYTSHFRRGESGRFELRGLSSVRDLGRPEHDTSWDPARRVASAWLHLHDATIEGRAPVEFEVYFQLDADSPADRDHPGYAASVTKSPVPAGSFVSIEVTRGLSSLAPGQPPRVSIALRSPGALSFASATLVVAIDERTQA